MSEQSPAEKAYAATTAAIEQAIIDGATQLDLIGADYSALEQIPDSIADIKGLEALSISDTQVGSLDPLTNIKSLVHLDARGTKITDIGPLTHLTNLTWLDLSDTPIADFSPIARLQNLRHLYVAQTSIDSLAPIARLAKLEALSIFDTNVTNIAALQGLRGMLDENDPQADYLSALAGTPKLKWLTLSYTDIADLRPILSCPDLEHPTDHIDGVDFDETTATRNDPHLHEISEIENNAERAKQLFTYLRNLPPLDPPKPPKPDDYLPVEFHDGQLNTPDRHPSAKERADTVKRKIHARLIDAASTLQRAAGNEFSVVSNSARSLFSNVNKPFEQLDMLDIHMDLEELRDSYDRRKERGNEDRLTGNVVDALGNVTRIGPGLTMDNQQVEVFEQRVKRKKDAPEPENTAHAHDKMSMGLSNSTVAGENLRTLETAILRMDSTLRAQRSAVQEPLHRNLLITAGTVAATNVAGGAMAAAGGDLYSFLATNAEYMSIIAQSQGDAFMAWFHATMTQVAEHSPAIDRARILRAISRKEQD